MKAIFPTSIGRDLPNLVHLSSGFRMMEGAEPLHAGAVCKAEAQIASVINSDTGKASRLLDTSSAIPSSSLKSLPSYTVVISPTTKTPSTSWPGYLVPLTSGAAVSVLQSKEWFEWFDATNPLQANTSLVNRLKSEITFKNKSSYRAVPVSGDVSVQDRIKQLVKVGYVDFEQGLSWKPYSHLYLASWYSRRNCHTSLQRRLHGEQ